MRDCDQLLDAAIASAGAARAHLGSLVRITHGEAAIGGAAATYSLAWRARYAELKEARDQADAAYQECMERQYP